MFVVDELDKIFLAHEQDNTRVVNRIVASLKNFFTLGAGVFVFITGDDFVAGTGTSIGDYPPEHTLFSDRIHIHALGHADLEQLIDRLVDAPPTEDQTYRQLRNYLCWESNGHVFDLLGLMSSMVEFSPQGLPVLIGTEAGSQAEGWRAGNLQQAGVCLRWPSEVRWDALRRTGEAIDTRGRFQPGTLVESVESGSDLSKVKL